jgi:transcriptional regulator with XRE-family HTH domain
MSVVLLDGVRPGDKVERLLFARDMSVNKLAKKIGRSRQVVNAWVKNESIPRDETEWKPIAEFFGMTLDELLDPRDNLSRFTGQLSDPKFPVDGIDAPMALWPSVPCGDWEQPDETTDFIDVPGFLVARDRIASKVQGESMEPRLQHGDLLIFQMDQMPRYGRIVLARNGDNEVSCKVLKKTPIGADLVSLNPDHPSQATKRWEVLGYLIAILRDYAKGRGSIEWDEGGIGP